MSERSAADEARIEGLTCVITGAASERGIGRGVALTLARADRGDLVSDSQRSPPPPVRRPSI